MNGLADAPGMIALIDPAQPTGWPKGKFMIVLGSRAGGTSSGPIEEQSKARRLT